MNKQYEQYSYFDGHRGTHIGDGIYKVDEPFESDLIKVFDNDIDRSAAILFKWIDFESVTIKVMYFKIDKETRFDMQRALVAGRFNDDELHYLQSYPINEIGGVHRW